MKGITPRWFVEAGDRPVAGLEDMRTMEA